jgi:DNA-binding transcriptional LysR family regulator
VCEELHFGRAAKRLHISQPPLSQQIRQLEEDLHVQLFYRTRRKVELTDAGRVFAGEARLILQQVERAAGLAVEANRSKLSRLVVACSPANVDVVLKILKAFTRRHPKIHIVVKSLVTPRQVEALRNGRIDIGFLTLPVDSEGLVIETILQERLVVALPEKHPLAARRRIPLRALAGETLIIFPLYMSPGRFELIARMCQTAGLSLHVVHEVDNIHTMLELISSGIRKKGVVFRELQHSPSVETGVAYRREHRSKALLLLIDIAKGVVAS